MAMAVERSGLTKGAFYFHFPSKQSLAVSVLEAKQQEWLDTVSARLAEHPPGAARLHQLLPVMLELHEIDPDTWAVSRLTKELAAIPETHDVAAELMAQWIELVAGLVRDAQELGEADADVDPTAIAIVMISAFDGLKALHDVMRTDDANASGVRDASFVDAAATLESMVLRALDVEEPA